MPIAFMPFKNKTLLITGADGFIFSPLIAALIKVGAKADWDKKYDI